jgi:hypothetical protein
MPQNAVVVVHSRRDTQWSQMPRVGVSSRSATRISSVATSHCLSFPTRKLLDSTVYDVVPLHALPQFDPTLTVKKLLVPRDCLPRLNGFLRRHATAIRVAYLTGLVCRTLTAFIPMRIAQWTALATLPLQLPAVLNIVFQFRVAFLRSLIRTYDFWHYLAMNTVWAVCLAWYFHDARATIVPLMWVDVQNATLLDSFLQDIQVVVSATWLWCLTLFGVMGAVAFLDDSDRNTNDVLLVLARRTITIKEVLLNAIATVVVLIARIVYRKRASMRGQQKGGTTIQSITLTWSLQLKPRARAQAMSSGREWQSHRQLVPTTKLHVQLTLRAKPIKASDVLVPCVLGYLWLLPLAHWPVRLVGIVGLGMLPAVFCMEVKSAIQLQLALAGVVCTAVYCALLVCFYQRRLFQRLIMSFDFAFLSLQLTVIHLCVADAFQWHTAPTLCVISSWLWLHVAMTLDALTPVMRRVLGFSSWFQVPVLLLTLAAAVLLWLELSIWDSRGLYDRRFVDVKLGLLRLQLHVVPCLLSRLLTVCLWAMRMLYRIASRASDQELLFIRSHVELDALFHKRQRSSPTTRIAPT